MTAFAFTLLVIVLLLTIFRELLRPAGYLRAPFLFAVVVLGFLVPQIWSVWQAGKVPEDALEIYVLMALACFAASLLGWQIGLRRRVKKGSFFSPSLTDRDAKIGTIILTAIAVVSTVFLLGQDVSTRSAGGYTGISSILHLFTNIKFVSLTLSVMLFLRQRDGTTIVLLALNLLLYFPVIFLLFRRRGIAEFAIAIAFALYFVRGIKLPRFVVITGVLLGSVFVFAVAELRNLNPEGGLPTFDQVAEINFLELTPLQDGSAAPEVEYGVMFIHAATTLPYHTYGAQTRDRFVHQYVPAQLVGLNVKLRLKSAVHPNTVLADRFGYRATPGTTRTGVGDAFLEFHYFGALIFFFIAYFLGRYWRRAVVGNVWDKAFYVAALIPAIVSFSNYSGYFFVNFMFYVFLLNGVALVIRMLQNQYAVKIG